MRKTNYLQIVTFDLQRAAGPYRWASCYRCRSSELAFAARPLVDWIAAVCRLQKLAEEMATRGSRKGDGEVG